ncbi:MAG: hypothetical protein ACXW1M_07400, partial [Acidimicrobiia bacterium]
MTGRGAESMNDGTDIPVGAPTTSTAIPTDDALPSTRADSINDDGDDGGPARRARRRPEKPSAKARWKTAAEWGGFIVAALVIAFVVKTYMFQAFFIPSES